MEALQLKTAAVPGGAGTARLQTMINRTYDQLCPVAETMDLIGDRWTLLLLRDLLWHGPHRYQDLLDANPGISPTLLADRLRSLAAVGLVEHAAQTGLYGLTDAGFAIKPVIDSIYRFGATLATDIPISKEKLAYLVMLSARSEPGEPIDVDGPGTVELSVDGVSVVVEMTQAGLRVVDGQAASSLVLTRLDLMSLLSGSISIDSLPPGSASGDLSTIEQLVDLLRPQPRLKRQAGPTSRRNG